nr:MAG TPA: hypothetical protein [Caudoviricetes sp.]
MYYAQIKENNICFGISKLSGIVNDPNLIEIDSYDTSLLGKRYVNGVWEDAPQPIPTPTEEELLRAEMLLNQCDILINQENSDAVLAQILLNQMEGFANV